MKRALKFKSHNFFDYIFHHLFFIIHSPVYSTFMNRIYFAMQQQQHKEIEGRRKQERENAEEWRGWKNKTFF